MVLGMVVAKGLLGMLALSWLLVAPIGCGGLAALRPCGSSGGRGDGSKCGHGEACLWVHRGDKSGYFCATTCGGAADCPANRSCHSGGASSCATCLDLVDICE
jgi:hypothetical protein